jgi:hypothetical protein
MVGTNHEMRADFPFGVWQMITTLQGTGFHG